MKFNANNFNEISVHNIQSILGIRDLSSILTESEIFITQSINKIKIMR